MMNRKMCIIIVLVVMVFMSISSVVYATNQIVEIKETEQPSMIDANIVLGIILIVEIAVTTLVILKHKDNLVKANIIMLIIFGLLTILSVVLRWVLGITASGNMNDYNEDIYLKINHILVNMIPITFIPLVLSIICLPISIIKRKKNKLGI